MKIGSSFLLNGVGRNTNYSQFRKDYDYDKPIRPIGSMWGTFTYIYDKHHPNVGKYTIHGSSGLATNQDFMTRLWWVQSLISSW